MNQANRIDPGLGVRDLFIVRDVAWKREVGTNVLESVLGHVAEDSCCKIGKFEDFVLEIPHVPCCFESRHTMESDDGANKTLEPLKS